MHATSVHLIIMSHVDSGTNYYERMMLNLVNLVALGFALLWETGENGFFFRVVGLVWVVVWVVVWVFGIRFVWVVCFVGLSRRLRLTLECRLVQNRHPRFRHRVQLHHNVVSYRLCHVG